MVTLLHLHENERRPVSISEPRAVRATKTRFFKDECDNKFNNFRRARECSISDISVNVQQRLSQSAHNSTAAIGVGETQTARRCQ
jgi:phage gpG-like protein